MAYKVRDGGRNGAIVFEHGDKAVCLGLGPDVGEFVGSPGRVGGEGAGEVGVVGESSHNDDEGRDPQFHPVDSKTNVLRHPPSAIRQQSYDHDHGMMDSALGEAH